ncbi:MAG TPA: metal ABC transporter ATP-binding protein [Candidatus Poseidoniales archaeon]|nr:MAG TPA: metal ABC transporter ATP-binding protein [Candidatus Poseidoniales archaeon]|tara:strand:+ start:628 stop:1410 length:783 start_codon:yes stop_codon:yes gene_type:complete
MMSKGKPIISVKDLKVQRGGAVVLDGVDLEIHAGDFVGLSGPNGSGKSTLLMAIIGELEPMAGSVTVFGGKPGGIASRGRIAWVSQAAAQLPSNLKISVRELVSLGTMSWIDIVLPFRRSQRHKRVEKAIRLVGLEDVAERDVQRLSGGQRQRAVVARGLATEAEVLILDEPLAGVDRASRDDFLKLLDRLCREEGKTLVMVTHDQAAIHQCTQCAICIDGNVRFDENHTFAPAVLQVEALSLGDEFASSERVQAPSGEA